MATPELSERIVAILTADVDNAERIDRLEEWSDAIDTVAENLYNRLPSGDYGRGDVKRFVRNAIAKRIEARNTN